MELASFPAEERVGKKEIMATGNEASVTRSYADAVRDKKVTSQENKGLVATKPLI